MPLSPVVIVSTRTLRPAREVSPIKFKLTQFEGAMLRALYQKRVLFFTSGASSDFEFDATVELLKSSLSEALVYFYPLAGRIRVTDDDESEFGLEMDCTHLSIRFIEAFTDARLEELGQFEPSEFNDTLAHIEGPEPSYPWKLETPLIFVQVTRFACGGVSVGVAFSHQVCDGLSFWHFMNSWGEIARTGVLSQEPVVTYHYKSPDFSDEELRRCAEAGGAIFNKDPEVEAAAPSVFPPKPDKLLVKLHKLTKANIDKLKSLAAEESGGKKFSSFEVITAYFWRRMAMARAPDEADETRRTMMSVLINCREKHVKSLPKAYFGNAVSAVMPACRVVEMRRHGLGWAASLLHDTIISGQKHLEGIAAFYCKCMKSPSMLSSLQTSCDWCLVVSSPHHPVFKTEFGFGRAVGVTFGTNDLDEGKLYLFPAAADGTVDATVVLQPGNMERFNQQEPEAQVLF